MIEIGLHGLRMHGLHKIAKATRIDMGGTRVTAGTEGPVVVGIRGKGASGKDDTSTKGAQETMPCPFLEIDIVQVTQTADMIADICNRDHVPLTPARDIRRARVPPISDIFKMILTKNFAR